MIVNLRDLDAFVESEVIEPFDHKYLNEEVAAFRESVPTTENLCIEIFNRLRRFPAPGWSEFASRKQDATVLNTQENLQERP